MEIFERRHFGGMTVINLEPVFVLLFEDGWTTQDYAEASEHLTRDLPERFAFLSLVSRARPAGALERQGIAETMEKMRGRVEHRIAISAVVSASPVMRGVIRAVSWLSPIGYPIVTCGRVEEAVSAIEEALMHDGIYLATSIRDALYKLAPRTQAGAAG